MQPAAGRRWRGARPRSSLNGSSRRLRACARARARAAVREGAYAEVTNPRPPPRRQCRRRHREGMKASPAKTK
eukprot:3448293-Pleurochrysis_carterae.AAC.1